MQKPKILIVEDNPLHLAKIKVFASKQGFEIVGASDNAEEASRLVYATEPNLCLLDINLSGSKSGIDLAMQIKEKHEMPIIFLTSLVDQKTIEEASKVEPEAFLVKPIDEPSLKAAIELALLKDESIVFSNSIEEPSESFKVGDSFFVKVGNLLKKVVLNEILVIQNSSEKYCDLKLQNGRFYSVRRTLKSLEKDLPKNFIRIHRNTVINLSKVTSISSNLTELSIGDAVFPIGKTHKKDVAKKINYLT